MVDKPSNKAIKMVAPARETPGKIAMDWKRPINMAFEQVTFVFFGEINLVKKTNKEPKIKKNGSKLIMEKIEST